MINLIYLLISSYLLYIITLLIIKIDIILIMLKMKLLI